jgi:hypothetical protein
LDILNKNSSLTYDRATDSLEAISDVISSVFIYTWTIQSEQGLARPYRGSGSVTLTTSYQTLFGNLPGSGHAQAGKITTTSGLQGVLPTISGTDTIVFEISVGDSATTSHVLSETTMTSTNSGAKWGALDLFSSSGNVYRACVFPHGWRIRAKKTGTGAMTVSWFAMANFQDAVSTFTGT